MSACMKTTVMKATVAAAAVGILFASGFAVALAQAADAAPYQVSEGNKVDAHTLSGWRTWRALACERCHGAAQEGMVGPSLVNSLKTLTKDQFK